MTQIILNMNAEQLGLLDQVATMGNLSREDAVKKALEQIAMLDEVGPEAYASIMRGKADAEAGRFVPAEEMSQIFARFKGDK